ncbi:hypothetical protein SK128_018706 [Halocaridina rubra]|uniref:Uncharacterized protein n=1 Tax=Halocaridina rubra TaxID=373956 RepID=A0AAN8XNY1_HALRR
MGNHHHHFASCSTTKEGIRQNYTEEIQNGKTVTEDEIRLLVPITAVSLERKSDIRRSLSFIFLFLALETSKQMSNFALAHSNDGHYPVPSSLLVALAELVKLLLVFTWAKALGLSIASWTPSIRFSLPAICYCLTNLMYMNALTFISPPIWMVLIQTRTLYTAVAYKTVNLLWNFRFSAFRNLAPCCQQRLLLLSR